MPTSPTMLPSSAQTTQTLPAAPERISPAKYQYLQTQSRNILASGGSEADVVRFIELEGHKMPPITESPERAADTSMIEGLSMNALQGITFGLGDEVVGSILGVLTGEGARGGREAYRNELETWNASHGKAALAAEIAGGVLTGGALAKLGVKGALAGGAVGGALSGAFNQEGGVTPRTMSALLGAGLGAAAAGALGVAGTAVGAAARPLVRKTLPEKAQEFVPGVGSARQKMLEALAHSYDIDGLDAASVRKSFYDLATTGAAVSPVDVGGPATEALYAQAVRGISPAKMALVEALQERQAQQGQALSASMLRSIFQTSKLGLANVHEAVDALHDARRTASAPHYADAFQQVVRLSDRTKSLLLGKGEASKILRQAYVEGMKIAEVEEAFGIGHGLKIPALNLEPSTKEAAREAMEKLGVSEATIAKNLASMPEEVAALDELPVRALDYMNRGLAELKKKGLREGASWTNQRTAAALAQGMEDIMGEVGEQVDSHRVARGIYAGFSEMMDAVELGKASTKKDPAVIAKELAKLNPFAQDFYRLGHANELKDAAEALTNEGADVARRVFGGRTFIEEGPEARRIRALFPGAPAVADNMLRRIAAETRISQVTKRVTPGALRRETGEQVVEGTMPGVQAASDALPNVRATGGVMAAAAARNLALRGARFFTEDVSDELAAATTNAMRSPEAMNAFLKNVEDVGFRAVARRRWGTRFPLITGYLTGKLAH